MSSNDFNTLLSFFKTIFLITFPLTYIYVYNLLYWHVRVLWSFACGRVENAGVSVSQFGNCWRTCSFVPLCVSFSLSLSLIHPMGVVVVLKCFVFVYMDGGKRVVYIYMCVYTYIRGKKKIRSKKTRNQIRKKCCYYYSTEENRVQRYIIWWFATEGGGK